MRDEPRAQDLVLSVQAKIWCASFDKKQRPEQLCALYPRIANRLALCWNDLTLASRVLNDLVAPRRRHRAGFPPQVSDELLRLRLLRPSPAGASNFAPLWDASGMASCDR